MADVGTASRWLRAAQAVVFGRRGDSGTERMQREWGDAVHWHMCDADAKHAQVCDAVGIKVTPTLMVGGVRYPGYRPPSDIATVAALGSHVTEALTSRGAVLYGADGDPWTRRQLMYLGTPPPAKPGVTYVNCVGNAEEQARCAGAGVQAVPAWVVEPGTPPVHGCQSLETLGVLATAPRVKLADFAAAALKVMNGDSTADGT